MFQLAVVNDCQMPFRFGFPSSVRATPGDDPCPGRATVNQSAAATTTPAMASKPIDRLLITSLYLPRAYSRMDMYLKIQLRADSQQPCTESIGDVLPRRPVCRGHAEHVARIEDVVDIEMPAQPPCRP